MAVEFETKNEVAVLANDNELLGRYLFADDPQALEELVRRHSSLVMGVCRNMLLHAHDAEDAFQGTFLILAKKARTLINHGSIAGWLYQVAVRNCLQIRRRKGRARETEMINEPIVGNNEPWLTISQTQEYDLIYQEINRLPDRYRDVIVLCHLQGHSRDEAAELLDRTESSVKAALARGRNLLRRRLIRSGLLTSALLSSLRSSTSAAEEFVSESLLNATLETCQGLTPTVSVGTNPQFVQSLANQGVMSMQATTFLKSIVLTASLAIATLVPLGLIAQQIHSDRSANSNFVTVRSPDAQKDQNETVTISETKLDSVVLDLLPEIRTDETNSERFSVDNSEEYWVLMMESFSLRAGALREKSELDELSKGEKMMLLAESFEMQARVVEAELNLKRIKSRAKSAPATIDLKKKRPAAVGSTSAQSGDLTIYSDQARLPEAKIPPASSDPVTPGEVLLVEFLNNPEMNRRVVVQADHSISLPLAGTIRIHGMNPKEIGARVGEELEEFLKDPLVFVCREIASTPARSRLR